MSVAVEIRKVLSPAFALDVRFTTTAGITIVFGASGSGKTTVLRCLAGLARPDAGRIAFGDRIVFDSDQNIDVSVQQRSVGYVFQQLALFPHMTIERNIGYGLRHLDPSKRRERVQGIADSFSIGHVLDRPPDRVSGGERQRAALARALVSDPSILLLDEPLSALDHRIRMRIMEDLRRWNETHGIPVLYVTHSHHETFALGEHLVLIEDGTVVGEGSPHELLDRPSRGLVASLVGFENILEATVVDHDQHGGTMQCRLSGSATCLEVPLEHVAAGATVSIAIRAGDILVASDEPHGVSARNILHATLVGARMEGPTVVATFDAGGRFTVHLTPRGFSRIGLHEGAAAWLVIKTYSCRVLTR